QRAAVGGDGCRAPARAAARATTGGAAGAVDERAGAARRRPVARELVRVRAVGARDGRAAARVRPAGGLAVPRAAAPARGRARGPAGRAAGVPTGAGSAPAPDAGARGAGQHARGARGPTRDRAGAGRDPGRPGVGVGRCEPGRAGGRRHRLGGRGRDLVRTAAAGHPAVVGRRRRRRRRRGDGADATAPDVAQRVVSRGRSQPGPPTQGAPGRWQAGPVPPSRRKPTGLSPLDLDAIPLAPLVLVKGAEGYFVDAVTDHLLALAKERDPQVEVTRIDAAAYQPHQLDVITSPSLFEERRHVVVDAVDAASDAFITDGLAYLERIEPELGEVSIVLRHTKGVRGKKLLDAIAAAGLPVVQCDPLKRDSEKVDFVSRRFKSAGRRASADAVRALVEALGSDLRELASGVQQLVED